MAVVSRSHRALKRKYRPLRQEFKKDILEVAKNNRAFAMMIVETYTASQHRTHIMKVWELLGFHHQEAYKDYCDKLMGKHLSGRDEIMRSICFADKELYEKYIYKIPECYAMGDALAVAYRVLKS
ncbi:hypothetical protein FNE59_20400 [Bacillus thuringiensis]|uniref:hypothetical protein n=1 Tax=Bacillus cereus group TaxID=86661 RepID=UPI0018F5314B|nr:MULTISPECIES: hypothetical protein [Bacillus cereus group]MBJ7935567.1 hypothetical protein [Bacillus cereus]MDR5047875.1 hypothetical protein [Bacillus thuringiensis]